MNDSGWIKLHRKIKCNSMWPKRKPYSQIEAWLDILLSAKYEGEDAGTLTITTRSLAEKWKWSNKKVFAFLDALERKHALDKKGNTKETHITVTNWELYQCKGNTKETRRKHEGNDKRVSSICLKKEERRSIVPFQEIVDYLNEKAGTNYRASSQETQKYIIARWNADFTLDDFKRVIDKKVAAWKDNPEMVRFLRPSTLFGTKFEQYLNELEAKPQQPPKPKLRPGETEYQIYDPRNDSLLKWTPD